MGAEVRCIVGDVLEVLNSDGNLRRSSGYVLDPL